MVPRLFKRFFMRRLMILATALVLSIPSWAQKDLMAPPRRIYTSNRTIVTTIIDRGTGVAGIIAKVSFDSCNLVYPSTAFTGGYVTGNNGYGDREKLMRYALSDYGVGLPAIIDTVYAAFSAKHIGMNGTLRAKVYASTSNGLPGILLATSNPVLVSAVDTMGVNRFTFPSSMVNLTTNTLFLGIDLTDLAAEDTVAILSVDGTCPYSDTLSAWEKQNDNNFYLMYSSWGYSATYDMLIFGHVRTMTLGIGTTASGGLKARAYPLPATSELHIAFTGQDETPVRLSLKDLTGKTIRSHEVMTCKGGAGNTSFDVSGLGSGLYFVELASGNTRTILKVTIQ